ncbi:C1 family peptidase [Prevotella falsenii]
MLATIETEHLMKGDSVNLSPDYVARMYLMEQVKQRLPARFGRNVSASNDAAITTRGMSGMLIDLIQRYGVHRFDAYHKRDGADYDIIERKLNQAVSFAQTGDLAAQINKIEALLDDEIGSVPQQVFLYGATYTPQEFARSVCKNNEYLGLTSFMHHPFGTYFPLEVPDNYFRNTFLNVPIDTLMHRIEQSVRSGHPVCWEGDTSEDGFSFAEGVAKLENDNEKPTQAQRQKAFETYRTTDDHCMEIVGIAHDKAGNKYFCCKNSWGRNNRFGGFMYLSYNYVRLKTIAVYVVRN